MSSSPVQKTFIDMIHSANHTVFYKFDENSKPLPYPSQIGDRWDCEHVRMPCSPFSFHPVDNNHRKSLTPRWKLIKDSLTNTATNIYALRDNIMSYNSRFELQWDFDVLIDLFENDLSAEYKHDFFNDTYPGIVKIALDLPQTVTKAIPLLKTQKIHSLSFSQMQIASLLTNAFLCTFPRRNRIDGGSDYRHFPKINFSSLFNGNKNQRNTDTRNKKEKLKCLLHYFKRVVHHMPEGVVTFTRRVLTECDRVNWQDSDQTFAHISLQADSGGSIFSSGVDRIKIDFANKYVGGGVLNNGCVQEEILFVSQPELIISCLFTEKLDDNECLLVQGTETFVVHSGYSRSFVFIGDFHETATNVCERDTFGRWKNTISMIDALPFVSHDEQFSETKILRDLEKAYCGFSDFSLPDVERLPNSVATGNWGCGAFRGDVHLKFILQIMACSQLQKNVIYHTFGDIGFADEICDMLIYLENPNFSVGALYRCLLQYCEEVERPHLFDYIKSYVLIDK